MYSLSEKFEHANIANNSSNNIWIPNDHILVSVIELSKTIKCVVFRVKSCLKISFSSLTYHTLFDFLYTGYQIIMYQNLEQVDDTFIKMNSFFKYWAKKFFIKLENIIKEFIQEKGAKNILLTGMSMGGAMSQCFFYYLMSSKIIPEKIIINVKAFGSPRIGNDTLNNWFMAYKNNIINYTICVSHNDEIVSDPVCYFPSAYHGYVNNFNLQFRYNKKIYDSYLSIGNYNKDTDITFSNFFREWSFIKKDDLKIWIITHQYDPYMKNL